MNTTQRLAALRSAYIATPLAGETDRAAWWDENNGDLKSLSAKIDYMGHINEGAGQIGIAEALWDIASNLYELAD